MFLCALWGPCYDQGLLSKLSCRLWRALGREASATTDPPRIEVEVKPYPKVERTHILMCLGPKAILCRVFSAMLRLRDIYSLSLSLSLLSLSLSLSLFFDMYVLDMYRIIVVTLEDGLT